MNGVGPLHSSVALRQEGLVGGRVPTLGSLEKQKILERRVGAGVGRLVCSVSARGM